MSETHPHPIYDIKKSYLENLEEGPFFKGKLPARKKIPESEWGDFLGFKVASKLGVPAGPLLNSKWISFAAEAWFDIVTYKTIRSREHASHPVPNMVYVETKGFLMPEDEGKAVVATDVAPQTMDALGLTNSFGMPSRSPEYLLLDIDAANRSLQPGQVMIVSVVGTPRPGEDFIEDFVQTARLACQGGAKIIEANFSCPNVLSKEGSIDANPESVYEISKRMVQALGDVPLIIKIGVIPDDELLKKVMKEAARAGVRAICGINTLSMKVVTPDGKPALGEKRLLAGVCGGPIRLAALDFIEKTRRINDREKLDLTIMATGGVTDPSHFDDFFKAGADVAMSAIGMLWDPYLAMRYHNGHN